MSKARRNGALGLSFAAVLGLMALWAVGAQASEQAWLENAADIPANLLVQLGAHTVLTLESEALQLEIRCSTIEGKDVLLIKGTTELQGELWSSSCGVFLKGAQSAPCTTNLLQPLKAGFKGKLVLVSGKVQLLIEPKVAGGNLEQVKFHPPCSLPETNNVKGSLLVECLKASSLEAIDCLQEEKVHLWQQGSEAEDKLTYGANPAKLLGVIKAELATGNPWCGHV